MTERQLKIKDEIIRISDILRFGFYANEQDYLYKFIERMNSDLWKKLYGFEFISDDFYFEFYEKFNTSKYVTFFYEKRKHLLDVEKYNWSHYGRNEFTIFIKNNIDFIDDEFVIAHENLIDDTCLADGKTAYSNRYKETGWYYILESKISQELKDKYKHKSKYTNLFSDDGGGQYQDRVYSRIVNGYRESEPKIQPQKQNRKSAWDRFIYGNSLNK